MEFSKVVTERRSVRKYRTDKVSQEDINYVLEAARLAPSWANRQCWRFVVVTDQKTKASVAAAGNNWTDQAPVLIVICALPEASGHKNDQEYYMLDAGIAMEHLILAAADRGLGTCWIGAFDENIVKTALNIPAPVRVVAFTPLGYPADNSTRTSRKALKEIVSYNQYGFPSD